MINLLPGLLALLFGGIAAILLVQTRRASRARTAARAGYLDLCQPLFHPGLKKLAETGFPRLSGQYRGRTFDIQVVPDSLTYRKLPCLWLLVTLPEPLPLRATFDLMMRATGVETFSNFASLPEQITLPPGFPEAASIRTDHPGGLPSEQILCRHLNALAGDRLKELVVAPTGVRLVWLAEEAERGRYLLFRDAELGAAPPRPEVLRPLMDALRALWADLQTDAAKPEGRPR